MLSPPFEDDSINRKAPAALIQLERCENNICSDNIFALPL